MESFISDLIVVFGVFGVFFGVVGVFFGVLALSVIVNGYVLSILWAWFVVPLGLPVISVAHSIGLAVIICWLTYQYQTKKEEDDIKALTEFALLFIVKPFAVLGVGYIVKQFM